MGVVCAMVLGFFALTQLSVDFLPRIIYPRIFIGVDFDVLPVSIVWAAVALVYLLPIGPGFIEIAYVLIFGIAIGFDHPMLGLALAAVMIFRLFQWLIPIPIGYGLIFYWQKRDNFNLLSAESAQMQTDQAADTDVS